MNHQQEEKVTETRIRWTDEEWNAVAIALMKTPGYSGALPDIMAEDDLRKAIEVLPPERRRPIYGNRNKAFGPGLRSAYSRIRNILIDSPKPEPAPAPTPEPGPAPEPAGQAKGGPIHWKPHEHDALAHELYRMSPHARYEQSSTLAGLTLKEVLDAQRNVLPPHRRRALKQIVGLRPYLVEAFKRIRNQLAFAEAQKFLAKPKPEPTPEPPIEAAPVPTPEPVASAPAPVAPPAAEEGINVHELALKALVEMMVPALAKALAPELAKYGTNLAPSTAVVAQVAQSFVPPAAAPAPAPAAPAPAVEEEHEIDPLEFQPPASYQPPTPHDLPPVLRPPEKVRLPMIGVLGLKPAQLQELRAAFPGFDIVMEQGHHSTKTVKSLQSAARVIAANNDVNSMNAMTDKMLRNHFGDRYVRVNGGMSMVKRQIQIWISAGAFNE